MENTGRQGEDRNAEDEEKGFGKGRKQYGI